MLKAMYERFTDRARKVMQLANQEAKRLNHACIGPEHILLGLVSEGSGVAANVLKNMGIDLQKIRQEVEKNGQSGSAAVTKGRLPRTDQAKKVIEFSIDEARSLNHNYVGTEHLILGLLHEQEGVAAKALTNLGITLDEVRQGVLMMLTSPDIKAPTPGALLGLLTGASMSALALGWAGNAMFHSYLVSLIGGVFGFMGFLAVVASLVAKHSQ
jgi:ATP-dependent Clp protease ATP-binding subunit ClpA